jgi:hypothetical protein
LHLGIFEQPDLDGFLSKELIVRSLEFGEQAGEEKKPKKE